MEAANFPRTQIYDVADIVAENKNGEPILVVKVKATQLKDKEAKERAIAPLRAYLQSVNNQIPFVMLADLENIDIFKSDDINVSAPIFSLKTNTILSDYEPEFSNKRIFWDYLVTLIEAWLRDLAYQWKSKTPPVSEQLASIGLLWHLDDGTTKAQRWLHSDTIY